MFLHILISIGERENDDALSELHFSQTGSTKIPMEKTTTETMQNLIRQLNRASQAYYGGSTEVMTDYEWDALFDQLKRMEDKTGIILPDSPTQRVPEDLLGGGKEAHEFPTLSLAKTKQAEEVAHWADGKPVWLSWKLDGLTLVATYDGGKLSKLVTRGNGQTGTNITHLAPAIQGIPSGIAYRGHLVVRGEAVISYADFKTYLLETGEDYANPRNLASGSLTLKDAEVVRQRRLRWIPFTLVFTQEPLTSWGSRMDRLEELGFKPVDRERIGQPSPDNIRHTIDLWTEKVTHDKCPYPVDGLVVCYDDTVFAAGGSVTGHHATRGGLAFKWQDESASTSLDHIEWSCAASTISPVAVFEPVSLEGTTVKRASLCNISECERLGIGGAGTRMEVIKANKIIPKVIRVTQTVGRFDIPEHCPVCHHPTEIRTGNTGMGTRTLHCTNADCPAKQLRKFTRFVSKEGMDIDGISQQTLDVFINRGWIATFPDIYRLGNHLDEMKMLDGFGEKSVANIMKSIKRSRLTEAKRLLYALSIPLCGIDVCRRLLAAYPLDELIRTVTTTDDFGYFSHIDGIGPEKSSSFVKWFRTDANRLMVERLLKEVTFKAESPSQPGGSKCTGLTFVITGDVHHYKNRNELKAYIESQGGKVTGSVSGSTDFLINNDAQSTSGKNKKARELGIAVITEDDFLERFGDA